MHDDGGRGEIRSILWVILASLSEHRATGGELDEVTALAAARQEARDLGLGDELRVEYDDGIWVGTKVL